MRSQKPLHVGFEEVNAREWVRRLATSDRESLVRCRANLSRIYGGRSRSGEGFPRSTSVFNRQ